MLDASVGDAMRHAPALGYCSCDTAEAAALYCAAAARRTPAPGLLMLRCHDPYRPAWLSVDGLSRGVCFAGTVLRRLANPPGTTTPVPDADRPEEMRP